MELWQLGGKELSLRTYTRSNLSTTMERKGWRVIVQEIEVSHSLIKLISVRWVNAIWTVLEQSRGPNRQSLHVHRPTSIFSSSDEGSMSAWHNSNPLPHSTTDDAFITTSGGFHAPLTHRDSRRLAAGGLDRTRSLRRVASEADLSDPVEREFGQVDHHSAGPLTADVARARPASRDFTFARGLPPPVLSPPPMYTSPIMNEPLSPVAERSQSDVTSYHTPATQPITYHPVVHFDTYRPPAGQRGPRPPSTTYDTAQSDMSAYRTPAGQSPYTLPATFDTIQSEKSTYRTPAGNATRMAASFTFGDGSSSMVTAHTDQTFLPPRAPYTADPASIVEASERSSYFTPGMQSVPSVAVTGASPRQSGAYSSSLGRNSYHTPASGLSDYRTAPTASELGSPFVMSEPRSPVLEGTKASSKRSTDRSGDSDSVSSYQTAPPPVPSRDSKYTTATQGHTDNSPRYQLQDAPVPSRGYSYSTAPPASITEIYDTAPNGSSEPATAVSRALSFSSEMQEQAETATHISDGTDYDLIADLERQSSAGSAMIQRRPAAARTRQTGFGSRGTTRDEVATVYQTAGESMYATAPSWHTTSYYTAPEPASSKPSSVSTAQSTANQSGRSRRVPVPSLPPPSPSVPSSQPSSIPTSKTGSVPAYSEASTIPTRAGMGYDLGRMMVSLLSLIHI